MILYILLVYFFLSKVRESDCTSEEMNCPAYEENIDLLGKLVFNLLGQLFPFILLQFVLKAMTSVIKKKKKIKTAS